MHENCKTDVLREFLGMKGLIQGVLPTLLLSLLATPRAVAGDVDHLLMTPEGRILNVKGGEEIPEGSQKITPKVNLTCPEAPGKTCIKWKLALPPNANANDYLPGILTALNTMTNNTALNVSFFYNGTISFGGSLYSYVSGSDPAEIELDSLGNKVINPEISGNFLISVVPANELQFGSGVVSTTARYIVPDLSSNEGDIQWGGIFLNPAYTPGSQYRLDLVIAHEAMRLLGLAPSASRSAILFPAQSSSYAGVLQLSKDDIASLQRLYPASGSVESKGSVSGEVIDGDTGEKLGGTYVELIPISKMQAFAQTAERKLAETGSFSRENGVFSIKNVSPGQYVVIFENVKGLPLATTLWDDWIYALGSEKIYETEFYDGASRESNHETALNFSPQLIYAAAVITVQAGQDTSNVQLITNSTNLSSPLISAQGSTNEILPSLQDIQDRYDALKQALDEPPPAQTKSGGGGCALEGNRQVHSSYASVILILIMGSIGIFLRRRLISA